MQEEKAFIVSMQTAEDEPDYMTVIVHHSDCRIATEFAKNYFGDQSVDFRNRYRVTYLCSDFNGNHTFEIKKASRERKGN